MNKEDNSNCVTQNDLGLDLKEFKLDDEQLSIREEQQKEIATMLKERKHRLTMELEGIEQALENSTETQNKINRKKIAAKLLTNPESLKLFLEAIKEDPFIKKEHKIKSLNDIVEILSFAGRMRYESIKLITKCIAESGADFSYAADKLKNNLLAAAFYKENDLAKIEIDDVPLDFYSLYREGVIKAKPAEIKSIATQGFEKGVERFELKVQDPYWTINMRGQKESDPFHIEATFLTHRNPLRDNEHSDTSLETFLMSYNSWNTVTNREFKRHVVRNIINLADKISPDGILNIPHRAIEGDHDIVGFLAQDEELLKKTSIHSEVKRNLQTGARIFNLDTGMLIKPSSLPKQYMR